MRLDHLVSRANERLARNLPERLAGQFDLRRASIIQGWNFPLNGQLGRQGIVRDILAAVPFDRIVETGTYRGATSAFLTQASGLPVETVELSERFALFAERVLSQVPQVTLHRADSREFLAGLTKSIPRESPMFFYLDAHWNADVPRITEIEIIRDTWENVVIMIDDFKVRDDLGYGFTRYNGHELDLDYLPDLRDWRTFYPALPSAAESGARRGCLVIASTAVQERVAALKSLRTT